MGAPGQCWRSTEAGVSLTLLPAAGATNEAGAPSAASGLLVDALGPVAASPYIPQVLLDHCTALDAQAAPLLAARDALVASALPALSAYSAVLRSLLPPNYPDYSQHQRWGRAVAAAMTANSMQAFNEVGHRACVCGWVTGSMSFCVSLWGPELAGMFALPLTHLSTLFKACVFMQPGGILQCITLLLAKSIFCFYDVCRPRLLRLKTLIQQQQPKYGVRSSQHTRLLTWPWLELMQA